MSHHRHALKRVIAGALFAGGVAVASLGLAAGTAQAYIYGPFNGVHTYGPFQWCPGQPLPDDPPRSDADLVWDMSVCHTYYFDYDVRTKAPAHYWEGPDIFPTPIPPPPPQPLPADCPPWSPILASQALAAGAVVQGDDGVELGREFPRR